MASQSAKPVQGVQVVEMHMLDKRKYFPLATLGIITRRSIVHPSVVIKTRLMVQKQKDIYKGTFDAFVKITKYEGFRGLYKGYGVGQLFIFPQITYITTYESVRNLMTKYHLTNSNKVKSLVGGFSSSIVAQTLLVPLDVVVQRLMLIDNNKLHKAQKGQMIQIGDLQMSKESLQTRFGRARAVCRSAYNTFGIRGFYKGYLASLSVYAPHSALWWFFYDVYCSNLGSFSPDNVPRTILQTVAGPLAGVTACIITNPMDTIKTRIQVQGKGFIPTVHILWQQERFGLFTKGLSARLLQAVTLSFLVVISYESIKKLSVLPEYKDVVRW